VWSIERRDDEIMGLLNKMTDKEREDLDYELKLQAQVAIDKAKKLAKNPLVQFAVGFIAADWYLSKRGR
jgi:hypothetical protein